LRSFFVSVAHAFSLLLMLAGAFFFAAGTIGLLRFPDLYCRLHALTKADNLGLGLLIGGLALQLESSSALLRLLLIWVLVLVSSSTASHLVARAGLREGIAPVEKKK
jgi:multicomponent Na+:H+ antiporter subunit G